MRRRRGELELSKFIFTINIETLAVLYWLMKKNIR